MPYNNFFIVDWKTNYYIHIKLLWLANFQPIIVTSCTTNSAIDSVKQDIFPFHEQNQMFQHLKSKGMERVNETEQNVNSKQQIYAENLGRGTDGFTSPPKEGVLRIFICP